MAKKKCRLYSLEFKHHALKRASEDGVSDKEVGADLGIGARQLRRWRDLYRLLGDQALGAGVMLATDGCVGNARHRGRRSGSIE